MNTEPTAPGNTSADFLRGGGDLGARMRAMDWAETSLGPAEHWPQSLKTAVRITLTSRQPMFVWWGRDLINLYNDAYISVLGGKHPNAFAKPASEVWAEIWDQVSPRTEWVMHQNEGTYDEALLLIMERNGYPEETYYTFSYSPVPNDQGGPGGIICANTEDTLRIIGERQLTLLRELATGTADARTLEETCILSTRCLSTNLRDFPFAMIYLVDRESGRAALTGTSGIEPGHIAAPAIADYDSVSIWPIAEAIRTQEVQLVNDLQEIAGTLPTGDWGTEPHQAVVIPIMSTGQREQTAVLVAALNPFRLFDDNYSRFIDLVASQIAASSANAQAYQEERKRAERLAELDRAKTAFFSNVSHEFRTPLTLMLGPLDDVLAQQERELGHRNQELLAIVHRNGQRLLKLVNTLLDFSRIEAGRLQASFEPVDLSELTAEVASVFRAAVEKAGMKFVVDCPVLPEPLFVDRDLWEKIVLNLVSNAFKYTLEGEIRVALHTEQGAAILTVQDTGTGIPASELPNIFNRFHRVEGARGRTHEGTGIGLAIVQEFARLHGGTVHVESVYGRGSTFTVAIPLGSEHLPADRIGGARTQVSTALGMAQFIEEAQRWVPAGDDPADQPPSYYPEGVAAQQTRGTASRATILLADDNADMRDYMQRLLLADYDVIAVGDGMEALQAAIQHHPQLVLTDVMMPNLDGFELLKALRADSRTVSIPVIMLSARAGEEARVEGLESGADDYLTKPFSSRELLARIAGTLALAEARHTAMTREAELKAETTNILESINEGFVALSRDLRFTYANREAERIFGMERDALIGERLWDVFPPLRGTAAETEFNRAMTDRTVVRFEFFYEPWARWFEISGHPSSDGGIAIYFRDVSEHKRMQAIVDGQKQALELAVHGAELRSVLEVLTRTVEAQSYEGVIASILLLDEDGLHLRHGAAPGLPESYSRAIDGLTIGPAAGCCGTAAYTGNIVETADIATDPLWSDYCSLALENGLRSCWSTPILSPQGKVLGTFAIYHREARMPAPRDREVVDLLTHTASIIIERELAIRENAATKDNLALQVETLTRLHNLSRLLAGAMELRPALQAILETAVNIHTADYGLLSLYDPASGFLLNSASVGLDDATLDALGLGRTLPTPDAGACGNAFVTRKRAIVADTETDPRFDSYREAARAAGFRAVHSTPILTRSGDILGVLTAYFRESRQPTEREMQLADMCALYAADAIEASRSQQALRESEQRFRSMADNAPIMVWVTDPSGHCTFLSKSWYEFTGQTPDMGLGFGWLDAVHPEDRPATSDAFMNASNSGQPFRHEYRLHHRDGSYRWAIDAAAPRFDAEGGFLGYIGSVIDITDRKLAEESLHESGRRKDEFLATLAHELRNPLAPLRSGLELLRLLGDADPQTTEEVRGMMERQLGQMVRLIDDLLDVSRISRNKLELRREQVDLQDVVRNAVETSRPLMEQAGHELTLDIPAGPTLVHADATRLAQVFSNLLNNAAKYTRAPGHITLSVERRRNDVLVKVSDNGMGIPQDMLGEIFEMFTQVDRSLEKSHGGLGIGLTLVKRLVELHGGTVEASSAGTGMGSEFVVCLPRILSTLNEPPINAGDDSAGRVRDYRILVVDDNQDSARSLTMMLDFMNNVTRTAFNGLQALEIAEEFRPDIILLDIGMPGMNGYDVARSIREQSWGRQTVLIALTGWGQEEDRRRSHEAGFDHHLLKPVEPGMLRALLAGLKQHVTLDRTS